MRARWIDLGVSSPALFHASYIGLAESQGRDALPILLWGTTEPHLCLGASQSAAAELNPNISVTVCQRPLGGGAVWLDEKQYCYVMIVPQSQLPRLPRDWFAWALAPGVATFHDFDLRAAQIDNDIWLEGKKIAGSGAATINHCGVIASSFLMHFPAARFADCMRAPNTDFRNALVQGLKAAITDWGSHQVAPDELTLAHAFQKRLETKLGWHCEPSEFSAGELAARDEALDDVTAFDDHFPAPTRRRIKLNARTFLNEKQYGDDWVRIVTAGITIKAVDLSVELPDDIKRGLIDMELGEVTLTQYLGAALNKRRALHWAQIICQTAAPDYE